MKKRTFVTTTPARVAAPRIGGRAWLATILGGAAVGAVLSATLTPPEALASAPYVDPTVPSSQVRVYVCHLGADTLCERVTGDLLYGVEEDSPAFDCRVHGNRVCGEGAVLPDGREALSGEYRVVVLRG